MKTHYEELQLSPDAEPEIIHEAWRTLMRRYHPDNQKTGNAERARRINIAHDVLMDPEARAAYDATLNIRHASAPGEPDPFGHVDPNAYPQAYDGPTVENIIANAALDLGGAFIRHSMKQAPPTLRKIFEDALLKRGLDR